MLIWQLIAHRMATLSELETHWSIDDALRAAAVLDARFYNEAAAMKAAK